MKITLLSKILFVLCLVLAGGIFYIYGYFKKKYKDSAEIKSIFSELHGISEVDQVIEVLLEAIRAKGYKTYGFFKKKITDKCLECGPDYIPAFEKNAATKAFFRGRPFYVDKNLPADEEIIKRYGKDTCFVPLSIQTEEDCWRKHHCESTTCKCHGRNRPLCWLSSGKEFRGRDMSTFDDKIKKCFRCVSFRPFGVFAIKGKKPAQLMQFLNENFSGVLKNAVLYGRSQYDANCDALTKIMNNRALHAECDKFYRISLRYNESLTVCMIDIDHFKKFNDDYGHQIGDFVLFELASLMKRSIRDTDIVARYGGEEFTIILPKTSKDVAFNVLDKIRQKVQDHMFQTALGDLKVTISMGFATIPNDEIINVADLFNKADSALYQSKIKRNMVTAFDKSFPEKPARAKETREHIPSSLEVEKKGKSTQTKEETKPVAQRTQKTTKSKSHPASKENHGGNGKLPFDKLHEASNKEVDWGQ